MHVAMGILGSGIVGFPALLRTGLKVVCNMETTSLFGALLYCCFTLETKLGLVMEYKALLEFVPHAVEDLSVHAFSTALA